MQIVNRENIIPNVFSTQNYSSIIKLQDILSSLNDTNDDTIAPIFREKMEWLLDTYDETLKEDSDEMRDMKNYLDNSNTRMKTVLVNFIKNNSKLKPSTFKNIKAFIENITVWKK